MADFPVSTSQDLQPANQNGGPWVTYNLPSRFTRPQELARNTVKPLSAEVVLALIPSRICNYQFCNHLENLTLRNTRTVTFKLVAIKNRCLWFTQLYICASYSLFIFVNCFAFLRQLSFVHLFCSLFDYFVSFSLSFVFVVVQKKKNNSEPELCSGISILQYIKYPLRVTRVREVPVRQHHLESINIIQQTPPTLS